MNDELRAAFARLDRALQDARAACAAAGVPCPEEEKPTVSFFINYPPESWVLNSVTDIHVAPEGDTVVTGTKPDGGACTFRTTLTPERVRAACAREGVPCPEGEKPKTVYIISANTGGIVHLHDLRPIEALIDPEHGPCLRVNGYETQTPLADIRKQAAEAGIELPEVTVNIDSYRWTAIERADCHVCDDGSLLTGIIGVAERYGE
ncbi:MAG: hypothetical protein WC977_10755, partial [Anaerovoracaceae bacterium]